MIRRYIWFDSTLKCRSGKVVPYYECSTLEQEVMDQELIWFHEGYGKLRLYRVWKVDEENFVAEPTKGSCFTGSPKWKEFSEHPELALGA